MAFSRADVALNRKFLEMMQLLNLYLNHFPKHEKFALCNRIKNNAYEVFELIAEGQKRYHKKTTLQTLDIKHQQLRMQVYLANELGYFEFKDGQRTPEITQQERFMKITKLIDEVGKMIGSWKKQHNEQVAKNG